MSAISKQPKASSTTHVDVVIVGAGISGIGSAYHLQQQCPGKSYAILEMKDTFGGTWETHKYPGVRSDSDLYTFGYRFKPWVGTPIASAEEILKYMGEVIEENGIGPHIRYGHRITRCSWSSKDNLWTVEATRLADKATVTFTCNFLWMCQGYYDHEKPYIPDWPGMDKYKGHADSRAALGSEDRLHRQARAGDRLGRDGCNRDPGLRREGRARHDAAAFADVLLLQ